MQKTLEVHRFSDKLMQESDRKPPVAKLFH